METHARSTLQQHLPRPCAAAPTPAIQRKRPRGRRREWAQATLRLILPAFALLGCLLSAPASADFVITHAHVLTLADGDDVARTGYVLVRDGRIAATGEGELPASLRKRGEQLQEIDGTGRIVMPGFVSGHNHLWQSAFRGVAADGELYPWLQALHWTYGSYFGDGDLYAFTLHGALDQLMHGITTTYSHSQRLGATEAQYLESFDASVAARHHFVFAYNANLDQPLADIERDVNAFVARSRASTATGLLGLSMNAVGLHGSDAAKFALEMKLAQRHGMTTQIHYLEQYSRRFGERKEWPAILAAGAVGPHVSFAHFIHTTDHIVADTARLGGAMIWNPLSNGRLASGLADILGYQEAGIRVGMGVDGAASADIGDPFENMRMGLYALRMSTHNAGVMQPIDILRMHTLRTAEVMEVERQVGSIEPGKRADLLVVDPRVPFTGPVKDVAATLVFACSAANIDQVYVDGVLVVDDGVPLGQDTAALVADVQARVDRITRAALAAKGQAR